MVRGSGLIRHHLFGLRLRLESPREPDPRRQGTGVPLTLVRTVDEKGKGVGRKDGAVGRQRVTLT